MATLTIRNLSERTRQALKVRAARNNRSMEAEVRALIEASVDAKSGFVDGWLEASRSLRGSGLRTPARRPAREVDLR